MNARLGVTLNMGLLKVPDHHNVHEVFLISNKKIVRFKRLYA